MDIRQKQSITGETFYQIPGSITDNPSSGENAGRRRIWNIKLFWFRQFDYYSQRFYLSELTRAGRESRAQAAQAPFQLGLSPALLTKCRTSRIFFLRRWIAGCRSQSISEDLIIIIFYEPQKPPTLYGRNMEKWGDYYLHKKLRGQFLPFIPHLKAMIMSAGPDRAGTLR